MVVNFKPYSYNPSKTYYCYNAILGYNYDINVIISERGLGKTYGSMKTAISDFLYKKRKFAIMRDNEAALDKMFEDGGIKIINSLKNDPKFLKINMEIKDKSLYINGAQACYFMAVSTFYKNKGNNFDDVYTIIYDEFIPESDQIRIGDDVKKFINAVENVARRRKVRLILLANALDAGHGILELLGFDKIDKFGFYINKQKHAILHYVEPNPNFKQLKLNSLTGYLAQNSRYEANLLDNQFDNKDNFIYKKLPPRDLWGIFHNKNDIAVRLYKSKTENKYYVTKDINPLAVNYMRFTFDITKISPKLQLAPKEYLQFLKDIYSQHLVEFESVYIRNQFVELL